MSCLLLSRLFDSLYLSLSLSQEVDTSMAKQISSDLDPCQPLQKKSNQILVKFFIYALLIGLSFHFLYSHSSTFLTFSVPPTIAETFESRQDFPLGEKINVSNTAIPPMQFDADEQNSWKDIPPAEKSNSSEIATPQTAIDFNEQDTGKDNCDLFSGNWVRNPSGPAYTNTSCPFIEDPQNCMKNGRPDTGYQYWRWKPYGCDVPPFDADKFLEAMRGKSWAFIGDSILRNHGQSMVCLLSKAEMAVQVYHDEDYKSRTWHFPLHNFTLSVVWSPFLVKADIFENDDGVSRSEIQLHLNTLNSKWTKIYPTYDYVLISVGQWFLKTAVYWENEEVVGCHHCPRLNLTERGFDYAYHKVLQSFFRFVARSSHKPFVFYRTWTPDHFEFGEWSTGGLCNRTSPFKEGDYNGKDVDHLMYGIELEEFHKAVANKTSIKLLDTYHLSLLRPDGHPGPYRNFHPFDKDKTAKVQNDCLHWCLPGPIDSWNELLMKMAVKD